MEDFKKTQLELLDIKYTVSEISHSSYEFARKLDTAEDQ